jgi:DNA-binding SARP family transcriptional activator
MLTRASKLKIRLIGRFVSGNPDGLRISIPGRRGAALIAMLAVSKDSVRTRGWLQSQLWAGALQEANGSLRREPSELRKRLNDPLALDLRT